MQKTLYYGYGGAGEQTDQFMPQFGGELKYVFTHIAASYFYCGIEGFEGCTMADLEACGVLGWINYLADQPMPPDPYLRLSRTSLKAASDGSGQVTGTTTLEGDSRNYIALNISQNVTYHDQDTGNEKTGGTVRIFGGTTFYFSAPMSVSGNWYSGELRGILRAIWKALVVSTGDANQDVGSYYEEESGNTVSFSVEWMELAIMTMPATNSNGESEAELTKTQDTVYLKEITAPTGYRDNATAYRVTEVQAPKGFYSAKESKDVAIAYAGQMTEAAFSDTSFTMTARRRRSAS